MVDLIFKKFASALKREVEIDRSIIDWWKAEDKIDEKEHWCMSSYKCT